MKKLKKAVSFLLALVMVLSMSVTAFAADDTQYTITISNSTEGYEYTAYQIFKGDLSEGVLSNIEFGSALSKTDQAAVLAIYASILAADVNEDGKADYESSAAGLAGALADGKITAADFAAYIGSIDSLSSAGSTTVEGNSTYDNGSYTISVTGAGYYLIKNTDVPEKDGAYTSYILEVVGNVTVEDVKSDIPSLDKTVGDINDSNNSEAQGDVDSADYDIGDAVPFTLTATLPTNYGDYETYQLIFHDTMSKGLTFNSDSVKVTINGTEISSSNYTVDSKIESDKTTSVTITFDDLTTTAATASSKVVVTYTATLTSDATFTEGNNAYLQYSNDPNEEDGETTGKTPEDKTTVFTFTLTVNKVDESNNALKGAGFTLYKYDADATADDKYVIVGSEVKGDDLTSFTWSGLDDGQYKLVETTTPAGYNTMEDVEFYIVAEHTENGLTSLRVTSDAAGTSEIDGYTENLSNGVITANIVNYNGATLPSTGGIGTTIFYVVGGILVVAAAVLLITKGRMSRSE